MTYPISAPSVPDLPGAIKDSTPNGAAMRIGKVTRYDAGYITVAISDSDVLVDASYLFGAYQPVLGDNVAVIKQGNQWRALGVVSANPDDNPVTNYSFEASDTGSMPSDWTLYHDPSSAEAAAVSCEFAPDAIDGPKALRIQLDSSVVGTISSSTDYVSSSPIQVSPGQGWTACAMILGQSYSSGPWVNGDAGIILGFYANDVDTYPTVVSSAGTATTIIPQTLPWILMRSSSALPIEVPSGASYMRVTLRTSLVHENTSTNYPFNVYWDRVIARRLI
jgi:hypothetical protein